MRPEHMTDDELIRHVDNLPQATPLERLLAERMHMRIVAVRYVSSMRSPRTPYAQRHGMHQPLPKAEGVKHDASKIRLELLDAYAIDQLGAVLTFGAHKYAAHNWRGGIHKMRLLGALLRHTMAYLNGEDKDPESGFSHIAHAMCCCMFILGLEHRTDLDDRYKEPNGNP